MVESDARTRRGPRSPLASPALGTGPNDLIHPCVAAQPRPQRPDPPEKGTAIALAFSGGGFRATLCALGVARFLADAGLLGNVRYISSVSGGSVANGLIACVWEELAKANFTAQAYDQHAMRTLVDKISRQSLTAKLIRNIWRTLGPKTRTDLLARFFDEWFFHGRKVENLSTTVRFIFNAANVTTGVRFGFERDIVGDYVMGRVKTAGTGIPVSHAIAASAAVPGAFPPMKVDLSFPCAEGRTAKLLDGGVYDNLALEAVDDLQDAFLISVNAGGVFLTGAYGKLPLVRDLARANALLYRQTSALRMRTMVERFKDSEQAVAVGSDPPGWGRYGMLFGLATTMGDLAPKEWTDTRPEASPDEIETLALTPTSFSRFDHGLCEKLIQRGWWLAGAVMCTYHRDLLTTLPVWRSI